MIENAKGRPHNRPAIANPTSIFPQGDDSASATDRSITDNRTSDRPTPWDRAQFVTRLRARRRISRQLDSLCRLNRGAVELVLLQVHQVPEEPDTGGHWSDMGYTLGVAERRAAGRALAAAERLRDAA